MSISNNNNNNDQFEIPLKLPKALEESGTIQKFVIDINDKYVKLRLNSTYNPPISLDIPISIIKEKDGWTKFANRFRDLRKTFKKVSEDHKDWIYITVNENGSLIRSYLNNNNNNNNNNSATNSSSQQQNENNLSDTNDICDTTTENNTTKNEEKIIIEKVSVSQAIRRNTGVVTVTGTIIGVSILSKTISKVSTYCEKCGITDDIMMILMILIMTPNSKFVVTYSIILFIYGNMS